MGFQPTVTAEIISGSLNDKQQRLWRCLVGRNAHPTAVVILFYAELRFRQPETLEKTPFLPIYLFYFQTKHDRQ
ncbi:MAG: hypothetical protein IKZ88_01035 [Neisseriaceae bacterium]|nr:hypothetical protein [Neisseriaceae bacterium]